MIKLSISFVQLGYARVAARVGTAWACTFIEGTGPRWTESKEMVFTCTPLRHQTRTPRLRRCWPWGNTSFREMKDAGFCPANTCHTKLHLYHTVVVVGPLNTGSMAAPKPPIVGQSIAHTSVDNNQKHPRASSASWNQSLGGVDNQPRDTKRWLMRRLMLWRVAG